MDIKGETMQNAEPTPNNPIDIENKINLIGAIKILNILKSKVTLVKVNNEENLEKEYSLPYLTYIEKQAIEAVLSELERLQNNEEILNGELARIGIETLGLEEGSSTDDIIEEIKKKDTEIIEVKEANRQLSLELEKKDKVIDLMANKLVEAHGWFYSEFDNFSKEDFIKYFTNKVTDINVGE